MPKRKCRSGEGEEEGRQDEPCCESTGMDLLCHEAPLPDSDEEEAGPANSLTSSLECYEKAGKLIIQPCERQGVDDSDDEGPTLHEAFDLEPPEKKHATIAGLLGAAMRGTATPRQGRSEKCTPDGEPIPFARKAGSLWDGQAKKYLNIYMKKCGCPPCTLRWMTWGWWRDVTEQTHASGRFKNDQYGIYIA